jgi:CopG family transcriptional regulator/antitoxin EndoAI
MSNLKKIIISLPESLLLQTDRIADKQNKNRSELIREALTLFINEQKKKQIREDLTKGYEEMRELNLDLSEEGMGEALMDLKQYETESLRDARKRE